MITAAKKTRLTERQIDLVHLMRVGSDNRATFTSDQKIDDWAALKKVMTALGGTWKKGARGDKGGFVFADDIDAAEVIRVAGETGEILDPNEHDFFPTPEGLADALVARLGLKGGEKVLEPSAGRGALVRAIRRALHHVAVVCFEILPANVAALMFLGPMPIVNVDFLSIDPATTEQFDAVVMNPPFSKRADIKHVLHAHRFLRRGGRLAAIMSSGVLFREDTMDKSFRSFVELNQGTIEPNPPGSFKESGTMVNTVTVFMRKGV